MKLVDGPDTRSWIERFSIDPARWEHEQQLTELASRVRDTV